MAATSPKKLASNARYMAQLDRICIRPYRAEGAHIRQAAAAAGQPVAAYILQAVRARMAAEGRISPSDAQGDG